jgi:hypothetical protein
MIKGSYLGNLSFELLPFFSITLWLTTSLPPNKKKRRIELKGNLFERIHNIFTLV